MYRNMIDQPYIASQSQLPPQQSYNLKLKDQSQLPPQQSHNLKPYIASEIHQSNLASIQ